ncbi:excalibur calcium-binding domain-containing protein [Basfia succiniciproducens]|uniref:excalibur calcium-binding domain-containing protein n=1 Tax=Basfia succiniciproducens TaxID=653940 RepID=UPI003FCD3F25
MRKIILIFTALCLISSPALAKGKKTQDEQQFSCDDSIPYCKHMQSCEQAKFYLNQCGITRLDRDGDGVPCENICGKGKRKK